MGRTRDLSGNRPPLSPRSRQPVAACGIDVGDLSTCVAVADARGVNCCLNRESNRETPTVVSFGHRARQVGTDAAPSLTTNPTNTVSSITRLLGKQFTNSELQRLIPRLPYTVVESIGGRTGVQIDYLGRPVVLLPEQLLGAVLQDAGELAKADAGPSGAGVENAVVLSCPAYMTESERRSLLAAATVAGLNVLQLLPSTTAAALAYALFHARELPDAERRAAPRHLAMVELGHTALQVSIVALHSSRVHVLSHAWDRDLGGSAFADVLFDHFAAEFREKTGLDVNTKARAQFRLRVQCERVKKVLSANKEAPLNCECLMQDLDFHSTITRETFESLAAPIVARVRKPLEQALAFAGLSASQVDVVELIGGATRIPAVSGVFQDVFGREPSRTLHSKEIVAEGCARMAAMLTPSCGHRESHAMQVVDAQPYPIAATWADLHGRPVTCTLFPRGAPVPGTQSLLCSTPRPTTTVKLSYPTDAQLPLGAPRDIGALNIGPAKAHTHALPLFCAEVGLAPGGVLSLGSAVVQVEGHGAKTTDGLLQPGAPPPQGAPVAASLATYGPNDEEVAAMLRAESAMEQSAASAQAASEARNELEACMFDLRNRLDSREYAAAITEVERQKISKKLDKTDDWLCDDGDEAPMQDYSSRLVELQRLREAMEERVHLSNGGRAGSRTHARH